MIFEKKFTDCEKDDDVTRFDNKNIYKTLQAYIFLEIKSS